MPSPLASVGLKSAMAMAAELPAAKSRLSGVNQLEWFPLQFSRYTFFALHALLCLLPFFLCVLFHW